MGKKVCIMKQKSIIYLLFVMALLLAGLVARAAFSVSISPTSGPPGTVVTVTTSPDYGGLTTCYANGSPIGGSGATYTVPNGVSSVTFYCEAGTGEFYERTNDAVFTVIQPDGDGDGVPDGQDQCPNEFAQTANGCPDQPNQPNNNPNQPGNPPPNQSNQPGDGDGDGTPDGQDECPNQPGHADNKGCPLPDQPSDGDGDGVPDDQDQCPNNFGAVATNGCTLPEIPDDGPCTVGTRGGFSVNIRASTSLNSDVVGLLRPDAPEQVIGFGFSGDSPQEQEGWLQTQQGWVAARVTRIGGNCRPVIDPDVFNLPHPLPDPLEPQGFPEPLPEWDFDDCPVGRPFIIVMGYNGTDTTADLSTGSLYLVNTAVNLYQAWRTFSYVGDFGPATIGTDGLYPQIIVNDEFWSLLPDRETFPELEDLIVDSQIVLGTPCDDLIIGSLGVNLIDGRGGNDVILGLDGSDMLLGGDGDDIILSGAPFGNMGGLYLSDAYQDFIWGNDGDDILIAMSTLGRGYDNDRIYGGAGNDLIHGTFNEDWLYGGAGNDLIFGHGYIDLIWGGTGDDYLYGDFDFGTARYYPIGVDQVVGQQGQDLLFGGLGDDSLIGGMSDTTAVDERDALIGDLGADSLWGGPDDYCDYLSGEDVNLPTLCNTDSAHESIFSDLLNQQHIDFPPGDEMPAVYQR